MPKFACDEVSVLAKNGGAKATALLGDGADVVVLLPGVLRLLANPVDATGAVIHRCVFVDTDSGDVIRLDVTGRDGNPVRDRDIQTQDRIVHVHERRPAPVALTWKDGTPADPEAVSELAAHCVA